MNEAAIPRVAVVDRTYRHPTVTFDPRSKGSSGPTGFVGPAHPTEGASLNSARTLTSALGLVPVPTKRRAMIRVVTPGVDDVVGLGLDEEFDGDGMVRGGSADDGRSSRGSADGGWEMPDDELM